MAAKIVTFITFTLIVLMPSELLQGWGFKAHVRINSDAIDTLPIGIKTFFEKERVYISEHAVDPDKWKSTDKGEFWRHFIDLDLYGTYPFKELPRDHDEAVEKFGEEMVKKSGTLPWRIAEFTQKLADEMREGDGNKIRITAAALGHYIGDAHMPFHSAENYNGQFTNNKGVHNQFEKLMVNSYMDEYDPKMREATLVEEPLEMAFEIVMSGYRKILPILEADTKARSGLSDSLKSTLADWKADPVMEYIKIFYDEVGETGWQQMSNASLMLGRYWVTAWEKAGRPTLPK